MTDKEYNRLKLGIEGLALGIVLLGSLVGWWNVQVVQEDLEDARKARRLEQRPWVAYTKYQWEVERNDEWKTTDRLQEGERFQVRMSVSNTGMTPAVNVRYTEEGAGSVIDPRAMPEQRLRSVDDTSETEWEVHSFVMAGGEHSPSHVVGPFDGLTDEEFEAFRRKEKVLFFEARVEYCDVLGLFHWTEVAIRRHFGEIDTRFEVERQIVSPAVGKPDDQRCKVPDRTGVGESEQQRGDHAEAG